MFMCRDINITTVELIYSVLVCLLDESEEDEVAPPLSKRRRAAERAAEGREPIEEVSNEYHYSIK